MYKILSKIVISVGIKLLGVSLSAPEPIASREDVVFHFLVVHQDSVLFSGVQGQETTDSRVSKLPNEGIRPQILHYFTYVSY